MNFLTGKTVNLVSLNHLSKFLMRQTFFFVLLFSVIVLLPISNASALDQPLEGPGGADYFHENIITNSYGSGAKKYYLFEPDEPKPATAPLIVFAHGLYATSPIFYEVWINHLVKKGNIVVYPVYQGMLPAFYMYSSNAVHSVLDAIEVLQTEDHVRPDLDKFAIVGHSCGGVIAPNIAAMAEEYGLPSPGAVMSIAPGITPIINFKDLSKIPSETLLLVVTGDSDIMAGSRDAKKVFKRTPQIPPENKDYITLTSDRNGLLSLTATHFLSCCIPGIGDSMPMFATNALDCYGLWKLFDGLTDAAFYGINREYALGDTPEQRNMGEWSDGTPREELKVTDNP